MKRANGRTQIPEYLSPRCNNYQGFSTLVSSIPFVITAVLDIMSFRSYMLQHDSQKFGHFLA